MYGLGTIDLLPSGRYRLRIPTGKGKYRSAGVFGTHDEAERMRSAYGVGRKAIPQHATTVAEYGDHCMVVRRKEGISSWRTDDGRWGNIKKLAEWVHLPLDLVTRPALRDFFVDMLGIDSKRGETFAPQTVKHHVNLARFVFNRAHDDELIEVNPMVGIKSPRVGDVDNWTALSLEELAQLARCNRRTRFAHDSKPTPWPADADLLDYEQCTAILLSAYTGLRQGELAALERSDVHNLAGTEPYLWVCRSWDQPFTKTRKTRQVHLIPRAVDLLQQWLEHTRRSPSKYLWGRLYSYGYDWGWARTVDLKRGICWPGARRAAGISRRVTWHHLRDTCASHLLTGTYGYKWQKAEVAALLGHSDEHVTTRYARILPGAVAEVARRTCHEPAMPLLPPNSPNYAELQGRAMGDSNPRQPAPEADAKRVIPITSARETCRAAGFAEQVLRELGNGRVPSHKALRALAEGLLNEEWLSGPQAKLAARVLAAKPAAALAPAIELAGLLRTVAEVVPLDRARRPR